MEQNNQLFSQLTLLNWNANGLHKKYSTFITFLYEHNIDIACVSETHLLNEKNFKIPNYKIYRHDRNARIASGGVAIIIKHKLSHHSIYLPNIPDLEAVCIQLLQRNNTTVNIISAYKQPCKRLNPLAISTLFESNQPTLLLGDLNCKHESWGCLSTTPNGRRLLQITLKKSIQIIAPNEPTYYSFNPNVRPDILDIGLVKNFSLPIYMHSLPELDSDHCPVIIKFCYDPVHISHSDKLITGPVNWELFQEILGLFYKYVTK